MVSTERYRTNPEFDLMNAVLCSLGLQMTCFFVGEECGATLFGILFHMIGTRATLIVFGAVSAMFLAILLFYLRFSEHVDEYEGLPSDDKDDN